MGTRALILCLSISLHIHPENWQNIKCELIKRAMCKYKNFCGCGQRTEKGSRLLKNESRNCVPIRANVFVLLNGMSRRNGVLHLHLLRYKVTSLETSVLGGTRIISIAVFIANATMTIVDD